MEPRGRGKPRQITGGKIRKVYLGDLDIEHLERIQSADPAIDSLSAAVRDLIRRDIEEGGS